MLAEEMTFLWYFSIPCKSLKTIISKTLVDCRFLKQLCWLKRNKKVIDKNLKNKKEMKY